MKCANCGNEIKDSYNICPFCGERLIEFENRKYPGLDRVPDSEMTFSGINDDEYSFFDSDSIDQTWLDGSPDILQQSYNNHRKNLYGFPETEQFESHTFKDTGTAFGPSGFSYQEEYLQRNMETPSPAGSMPGQRGRLLIPAIIGILLLTVIGFIFFWNRPTGLSMMTYEELTEEYGLTNEKSDKVWNAFHENVRFEFGDPVQSGSGISVKAVIYTPDLETIYEQTTDEEKVVERLHQLPDNDLIEEQKTLFLGKGQDRLSYSDAEMLQRIADGHYSTPAMYAEHQNDVFKSEQSSNDESSDSTDYNSQTSDSDSGSDSSQNNATPSESPFSVNAGQIEDYSANLDPKTYGRYTTGTSDFSFMYPVYLFNQVTSNYEPAISNHGMNMETHRFTGSKGSLLTFSLWERTDSSRIADLKNQLLSIDSSEIVSEKQILLNEAEDSFARFVVTGYDASGNVIYTLVKMDGSHVMEMHMSVPSYHDEEDRLMKQYVTECVYRMCGFSKSKTHEPRSFEEFAAEGN